MRCYFHLVSDHEELIDDEGIEVSDPESAKVQAQMAVQELQSQYGGVVEDWSGWRIHIRGPEGGSSLLAPTDKHTSLTDHTNIIRFVSEVSDIRQTSQAGLCR